VLFRSTEVSIRRARRAYPPAPGTVPVTTTALPFPTDTFDTALAILSAHEIRSEAERIQFFRELRRVTQPTGKIYLTEHLRDGPNFLAYTIGFLHFHSRATWLTTFQRAGLVVTREIKTTPFITTFILE
jgi:SAM-dependent methyltransferase